jgi:hypothetical protein
VPLAEELAEEAAAEVVARKEMARDWARLDKDIMAARRNCEMRDLVTKSRHC